MAGEWERSLLNELNRARTKPREIATELTALKACYDGVMFKIPGTNKVIRTTEGVAAVNNAITFLESRSPISAFETLSEGLSRAALELIIDNGTKGLVGNTFSDGTTAAQRWVRYGQWKGKIGENLYFNLRDPKLILYQWIIDDSNGNRPNRKSIFDEQFSVVGIAQGPHIQHDFMVIVTFAASFEEGAQGVVPQVGNRSSPSSTTVQSALRKTEEEIIAAGEDSYTIQTDDLQVSNTNVLKLTAKGKVLTLGKTFKVDGKSKRQNFQWQLPFSFNAKNVNAQLIDGKGQIASNDNVVVGTYKLAPGSDQEKVTVEAKQSKEAFILRPLPSKYDEIVEVSFSADIVTLTCTHRGPDGSDISFQNPLRLPFVLLIDLFNVQTRPDGIVITISKTLTVEEVEIPIH